MRAAAVCVMTMLGCSSKSSAPPPPSPAAPTPTAPAPAPPTAVKVETPIDAPPPGLRAVHVFAGPGAACAVMSTGAVRCWGRGKATPYERTMPANIAQHDVDDALDKDGVLWTRVRDTWTKRDRSSVRAFAVRNDVLGGENVVTAHADGKVRIRRPYGWDGPETGSELVVPGIADVVQVAAVDLVTLFHMGGKNLKVTRGCALDKAGVVTCWDGNFKVYPTKLTGTQMVDARLVCTLDGKREVRCALPYENYMAKPQYVPGLDGAKQIAGSGNGQDGRVCGVFDDGSVACSDLIGPNFSDPEVKPARKITGLPPADEVAVGPDTVYVRLRDGRVMSWGINDNAQLGDGTWFDRKEPVVVTNLLDDPLPAASDGAGKEPDDGPEMDWSGVPATCAHAEELPIGDKPLRVVASYAWIRDDRLGVRLASFRLKHDTGIWIWPLRGSQRFVEVGAWRLRTNKTRPIAKGTYKGETPETKYAASQDQAWGSVTSSRGNERWKEPGLVLEVTQLSKTWVCGTLTPPGQTTPVPFAARRLDAE